jgi:hypothetical protein
VDQGFLPDGYEVPKSSGGGYMKLKQGANKFRVHSAPVMGWEYWTMPADGEQYGKLVRAKELWKVIPNDADIRGDRGWNPKHFWAMVVWNFETKAVEILQLTQTTIQNAIEELIHNEDWGDPRNYSLTISRKGEKLETEYSVIPSPAQPTPEAILEAFKAKPFNLEALFSGGNPFETADGPAAEEPAF